MQDLAEGKTIFGWVHPHVCEEMKQLLLEKRFSVYAWEEMIDNGMQVFYRNNELAGEASWLCSGTVLRYTFGREKGGGDRPREYGTGGDPCVESRRRECDCVRQKAGD